MKLGVENNSMDIKEVISIAKNEYGLIGEFSKLVGEIDSNFKIETDKGCYILKISNPNFNKNEVEFQYHLFNHLYDNGNDLTVPKQISNKDGKFLPEIIDSKGEKRLVRLLSWIDGRLFSSVNPINDILLYSLGKQAGKVTNSLQGFNHPFAKREFEWDIAQAGWTKNYIHLFNDEQKYIINYFNQNFECIAQKFNSLRKSVIHNDVNDNNILVSEKLINPSVEALIDYGDAIYTQTINDLAVCIAYGVMNKPDVLAASIPIVQGYNYSFPLREEELDLLYTLVAIRLIISVTKSAINKEKEPENKYLQISERPAWDVLSKWKNLNSNLAGYAFSEACGFTSHPNENYFKIFASESPLSPRDLFPSLSIKEICNVDMSVSSLFIGNEYIDNDFLSIKLKRFELENPNKIIAGGYLETRPFYITDEYKKEGNDGPEYRSVHLGVDFWIKPKTPLHSPFDGKVYSIHNNKNDKDYGPTIILEHKINDNPTFYTLYGHLSTTTLGLAKQGQKIKKGDLIGYIGNSTENGNWAPHLHFQILLDLLGNITNFPGVAFPHEVNIWKSLCPDPNLLFQDKGLVTPVLENKISLQSKREILLGKSYSISYNDPLHIVRGNGQYLIDITGRKYLDTVNNVAHVGHENPKVVRAGQEQMSVLNTNTRYLHENIISFADELLATFPEELSVIHFVNSGSEANELALRMAKTYTNQKDIIAVEVGYHGNTSACVEVSSYKFDGKGGCGAPEYTHIVPLPDSFRGIYQGDDCGPKYADHIKQQIEIVNSKGRKIAGFICESIISCGGQIELPKNYLILAYEAIHNAAGVCIADEVQVGCGRVGSKFWGFELHDVIPDIVTIGKPLGNGHPVAAVVCKREIAEAFNNGMEYFNTFGGNPVSCAIGKKVLEVIKREKLQDNANNVGYYLKEKLKSLQSKFPIVGHVRGQGLFLGFELVDIHKNPETEKTNYLANRMRELGILMSTDGKDNNVLKIKPPMIFTKDNADELILRLTQVFNEDFMIN